MRAISRRPTLTQGATSTLRFIPSVALSALDPVWTTADIVCNHGHLVFDTLHATGSRFQVHPQMAEERKVVDNGLTQSGLRPSLTQTA